MIIERRPSGSFLEGQPSGNPKRIICMFHAWQYDLKGNCVYISREKEGYQDRLCKENVGLRRLGCAVEGGGVLVGGRPPKTEPPARGGGEPLSMLRKVTSDGPPEEVPHHQTG